MEIFKTIVELCKSIAWPIVTVVLVAMFHKEFRDLLRRIKKAEFAGASVELNEKLAEEAKPSASSVSPGVTSGIIPPVPEEAAPKIEMSVSSGAYSTDYHAVLLAVGLTNRGQRADQIVDWILIFTTTGIEFKPSAPPGNLIGPAPWWELPKVSADEFVRGALFFRDQGQVEYMLRHEEPLQAELRATTLHGQQLNTPVRVSRITTLQKQIQ